MSIIAAYCVHASLSRSHVLAWECKRWLDQAVVWVPTGTVGTRKNMKKTDQANEPEVAWPVAFEQVEDAQLRDMLKATPAQRLALAEELLKLSIKAQGMNSPFRA